MKRGAPSTSTREAELKFLRGMQARGRESLKQMTRKTDPRPESIRATHNSITRTNKDEK
jgi:hypothetical protein